MVSPNTKSVISRAKALYRDRLQRDLESRYANQFVAIEPDSGEFFVGESFDEAVRLARLAHPEKVTYTLRIGHAAAFHLGVLQQ